MKTPTLATVVFLKNNEGRFCLARKKKAIHHEDGEISYGLGTYNGYGGKKDEGDVSIEDTAVREVNEEVDFAKSRRVLSIETRHY